MEFITGKHLDRRTFLRGMGAAVALPYLDAMVPAGRMSGAVSRAEAAKTPLIAIEEVHGLAGCNDWAATQHLYAPQIIGKDFEMVPNSALISLEPYQDYLTIVSNTDVRMAEAFTAPEIGGDHFRSSAVFLTQSHPKQTESSDVYVGTSLDQMHANRFGQGTPIPSMPQLRVIKGYGLCSPTEADSFSAFREPVPLAPRSECTSSNTNQMLASRI